MFTAIEFEHQSQPRTIEIDNETTQDVLPAELQSQESAPAYRRPSIPFSGSRIAPALAGDFQFDSVRVATPIESNTSHL
jgi:hypothetical protein